MTRTMPPLGLDYQRNAPGHRWPGIALLLIGVAICGGLFEQSSLITAELATTGQNVDRLKREAEIRRLWARTGQRPDQPSAAGDQPTQRLLSPTAERWEALLTTLENSADDSVTLLVLEPGAKEITISGEAKNIGATLDYVARLNAAPVLSEARLARHEVVRDHPQQPVRFTLIASWRGGVR